MSATPIPDMLSAQSVAEAQQALADGKTLPFAFMTNSDIHKFDLAAIFKTSWQTVCAEMSVIEPGAIWVSQLGDVPVIIVRDEHGNLRGFVNVCRHRGYPVVQDNNCSKQLTCRYHGWTYDLTGQLVRAPEASNDELSTYESLSLLPISVAAWRGCVFAHLDPNASTVSSCFEGLDDIASAIDFDLSGYVPIAQLEMEMPADWKLVYDNVVECYHCPSMHARTLNTLYEADAFEDADWRGRTRRVSARLKGSNKLHHSIQLFPGSYMVMDPVVGIVGRFYPSAPGHTRLQFNFLAAPSASEAESRRYAGIWSETLQEDHDILRAQQAGINAGMVEHGHLVSVPESSVAGVQRLILDAYRQAVDRADSADNGDAHAAVT